MREPRDSFLHFLADNLPDVTVRNLRKDPTSPDLGRIMSGAVNVKFLDVTSSPKVSMLTVVIDIVHDSELQAVDMLTKVLDLLQCGGLSELLDYTDPSNPQPLPGLLSWDANKIRFRPIADQQFYRYNGSLVLRFHHSNARLS